MVGVIGPSTYATQVVSVIIQPSQSALTPSGAFGDSKHFFFAASVAVLAAATAAPAWAKASFFICSASALAAATASSTPGGAAIAATAKKRAMTRESANLENILLSEIAVSSEFGG